MATATDDTKATNGAASVDTMSTNVGISKIFKVTPHLYGGCLETAMVNVRKLYLRQIMWGPSANQLTVIEPNAETGLGQTGVNNWAIYDGASSKANLVANGQGMYTRAGNWTLWFTLEFNNKVEERFKGSTLQVMGAHDDKENDWAIVGGTGEFTMARGNIKRRNYSMIGDTLTQELTIQFFCCMNEVVVPAPTMRGPWGGSGSLCEMEGKSQRLDSVTICYTANVDFIKFSYIGEDGQVRTAGIWGKSYNSEWTKTETIKFGPLEWVKQVSGNTTEESGGFFSQFQIVTNYKTYGPFGFRTTGGTPFSYTVPENETVVGFFGKTDTYIRGIGVYTI